MYLQGNDHVVVIVVVVDVEILFSFLPRFSPGHLLLAAMDGLLLGDPGHLPHVHLVQHDIHSLKQGNCIISPTSCPRECSSSSGFLGIERSWLGTVAFLGNAGEDAKVRVKPWFGVILPSAYLPVRGSGVV